MLGVVLTTQCGWPTILLSYYPPPWCTRDFTRHQVPHRHGRPYHQLLFRRRNRRTVRWPPVVASAVLPFAFAFVPRRPRASCLVPLTGPAESRGLYARARARVCVCERECVCARVRPVDQRRVRLGVSRFGLVGWFRFARDTFHETIQRQVDFTWEAYNLIMFITNFAREMQQTTNSIRFPCVPHRTPPTPNQQPPHYCTPCPHAQP